MRSIPLTQGYVAIVDDEDYALVSQFKWCADVCPSKNKVRVYAARYLVVDGRNIGQRMHQLILGHRGGIDHWDGDTLNNQRLNLRKANDSQNQANVSSRVGSSSRFKGVTLVKRTGRWQAQIKTKGKNLSLGQFRDEVDAATVYNFAAYELFGEFARLNTPEAAT